jgi:hypothetical protein
VIAIIFVPFPLRGERDTGAPFFAPAKVASIERLVEIEPARIGERAREQAQHAMQRPTSPTVESVDDRSGRADSVAASRATVRLCA